MSLDPLLTASLAIQVHAFAAIAAFVIGLVQFARTKGTPSHRATGYVWAGLMLLIAISSFGISFIKQFGPFSLIHLLSAWTLCVTPYAVVQARRGNIDAHRRGMISIFIGALVIAGGLTLTPDRIMHSVIFGP